MATYTEPGEPEVRKRSRESASVESSPMHLASPSEHFKRAKHYAGEHPMATEIEQDLDPHFNMNSKLFDSAVSSNTESTARSCQDGLKNHDEEKVTEEVDEHSMFALSPRTGHVVSGTGASVAGPKVWYTTELLEQIISYLPAIDIIITSGVDKTAYNCIVNSPVSPLAQPKMFLCCSARKREVWWYCENTTRSARHPSFELPRKEDAYPGDQEFAKRFFPVALCPLLELEEQREESAMERIQRQNWRASRRQGEDANLICFPAEESKYIDILLTAPSLPSVQADLVFTHDLNPALMIKAQVLVVQDHSPITFRSLLDNARKGSGDLIIFEPPCSLNNWSACHYLKRTRSVNDEIAQKMQEHGGNFKLDPKKSHVILNGAIVPSQLEWQQMDDKRAKAASIGDERAASNEWSGEDWPSDEDSDEDLTSDEDWPSDEDSDEDLTSDEDWPSDEDQY